MPTLRALTFQDWLLTVVSVVTVAFIWHVWALETPEPSLTVVNSAARAIRDTNQWAVQFVVHNRGDAPAGNVRVRILSAMFDTPERLALNDDFTLANELDPGGDMVRIYTTPRPPRAQPAVQEPAAAAPATAKGTPAAAPGRAATPAPPPAAQPAPARAPQSYVLVLQADYPSGGFLGGTAHRRWYYYYREGDGAAIQLGQPMKQRMAQAADGLLP